MYWHIFGYPRATTIWYCPAEGCDYEEIGLPIRPYARGMCRRCPKKERRRLVRDKPASSG
jgi:hypothetical protein